MRKKRKKRNRIVWSRLLGLMLAVNLVVGFSFSPITRATLIRVSGARPYDEERIRKSLALLKDLPCARVNSDLVESSLMQLSEVKSVRLNRNIFGRGHLEVRYYEPVACVTGTTHIALSKEGVLYRTLVPLDDLPKVALPKPAFNPSFCVCAGWQCGQLAEVARRVNEYESLRKTVVKVDSKGAVCLNSEEGVRIMLGQTEQLDEKFEKLTELLRDQPDILIRARELNLVSPTRPTMILRNPGEQP